MLPYLAQDQYDRKQKEGTLQTIILENSKIKATFYPQYGGRLASLYDKENKKELLFDNPVFQPANLAYEMRGFLAVLNGMAQYMDIHYSLAPLFILQKLKLIIKKF